MPSPEVVGRCRQAAHASRRTTAGTAIGTCAAARRRVPHLGFGKPSAAWPPVQLPASTMCAHSCGPMQRHVRLIVMVQPTTLACPGWTGLQVVRAAELA